MTYVLVLDYEYRDDGSEHVVVRGLFPANQPLPAPRPGHREPVRNIVYLNPGENIQVDVFRTAPPNALDALIAAHEGRK